MSNEPYAHANEDLYGKPASHSDYHIGDTVTYLHAGKQESGTVVYVVEASLTHALRYIVSPTSTCFPVEVAASELIVE